MQYILAAIFWTILFLLLGFVFSAFRKIIGKSGESIINSQLKKLEDFEPTKMFIGDGAKDGIAIDEVRNKICLFKRSFGSVQLKIFSPNMVLASQVIKEKGVSSSSWSKLGIKQICVQIKMNNREWADHKIIFDSSEYLLNKA